jgi:hypothetical protein
MLPAIDEISYGFGASLVSAMDARELSRVQLKNALNAIGQRESVGLQQQMERLRAEAAQRVEELEQAMKDAEALKTITAKDIRRWEEDDARVSPTALDAIIEVLNTHKALTTDEIAELRERAERLNELVEKGHKPQKDKFSSLLKDLMDDRDIGRPQLATALAASASPDKLNEALAAARQQVDTASQPVAAKDYSITARRNSTSQELQIIKLTPGNITPEHIHLIEAGALPSPDLYDLLRKGLEETKALETHEVKDFDRNYLRLRETATQTNVVTVTESVTTIPTADAINDTPIAPPAVSEIVVDGSATPTVTPSLVANLGLAPKKQHTDRKAPALDPADALTRYTTVYMEIFTRRNLVPPPSEDGQERNKSRTEIADKVLGITGSANLAEDHVRTARNKLVRQLRPLAFEPISDDVLSLVRFDSERQEFERLNAAMADVGDHIFHHSRAGIDAQDSLQVANSWLREHGVTSEAQIRELNNGRSLSEMITANEFKKNIDIPKQMERLAERLRQRYPQIAEEGDKIPMELVNFGRDADALQDYYNNTYQRFDSILDRLQSEKAIGRYAGAAN